MSRISRKIVIRENVRIEVREAKNGVTASQPYRQKTYV